MRKDSVLVQVNENARIGWRNSSEINLEIKPYFSGKSKLALFSRCVVWCECVAIPEKLLNRILNDLHEGHLGMV